MGKVLKVREVGDPILITKCEEVEIHHIDESIIEIIEDMKETLNFTGGFGIAADKCTYQDCEDIPTTVMINPVWRKLSEKTYVEYEGCLSVPSVRGKVERYHDIEIIYYNEQGEKITKQVHGFTARDIQHECDHLDGIVFLEKVNMHNGFATKEMINKYNLKGDL